MGGSDALTGPIRSAKVQGMTKPLHVLFDDEELREIHAAARRRGMTTADWVRDAVRTARQRDAFAGPGPSARPASLHVVTDDGRSLPDVEALLSGLDLRVLDDDPVDLDGRDSRRPPDDLAASSR
jgi:hypothetical protein